ncbi:hypothetical protein [Blastococcus sp. PRF04-17]|uniref:hypothetical protein n=1 Tax=Blastococcus sp. PRF04-17 TaxID=2933797 RepID=UPI001FF1E617|nr:hypothetical protein [Blastococcus sp. PRF04-17]UOY01538.1 hypothetical protein MVA48_21845 [Blastococcus sp. PRF04-17]
MTRTHSHVYVVAFAGWVLSWVVAGVLPTTSDGVIVALVTMVVCNTVLFGLAWLRVQRGDAWRDAEGALFPVMAEFLLMGFGLRLPAALRALRTA